MLDTETRLLRAAAQTGAPTVAPWLVGDDALVLAGDDKVTDTGEVAVRVFDQVVGSDQAERGEV